MSLSATVFTHAPGTATPRTPGQRFHLWIDGVGGYFVTLKPRLSLGNADPEGDVDVAILADLSRLHASLQREGSQYLLEAVRPTRMADKKVEKALLRDGDLFTLGPSCQFRFHQPTAVSASARLELVSGQRLVRSLNGILMMADTLVLGPGPQCHVQIPDLPEELILFRQKDAFAVRYPRAMFVQGQTYRERVGVELGVPIATEEVCFTLEAAHHG